MNSSTGAIFTFLGLTLVSISGCIGGGGGDDAGGAGIPTAAFTITRTGNVFLLDASESSDPDGDTLTYHWNWVLGNATETNPKVEVEFPEAVASANGRFAVSLVVRDPNGNAGAKVDRITFGQGTNEPPMAMLGDSTRLVKPGAEVVLDGSESHDPDGDDLNYEWIFGPLGSFDPTKRPPQDPCLQSSAAGVAFSTGCLELGEALDVSFTESGVYNYNSAKAPWVRGRITVDAESPSTSQLIEISNFGFSPRVVTLGAGSTVTFVNKDPFDHTATLEDYTPGGSAGTNDPSFRRNLDEGKYVARLIVTDINGERDSRTWGLEATADAPANPDVRTFSNNEVDPLLQGQSVEGLFYNVSYDYDVVAVLTWADPAAGTMAATFKVFKHEENKEPAEREDCAASQGGMDEVNSAQLTCRLYGTVDYEFRIEATQGILTEWELEVTGTPYSFPDFGDSCVAHHHEGEEPDDDDGHGDEC